MSERSYHGATSRSISLQMNRDFILVIPVCGSDSVMRWGGISMQGKYRSLHVTNTLQRPTPHIRGPPKPLLFPT